MRIGLSQLGRSAPQRRGAVAVWSAVVLVVLATVVFVVVGQRSRVRTEQSQHAAEAIASSTIRELLDERLLTGRREDILAVLNDARQSARRAASQCRIDGNPVELPHDAGNTTGGSLVFGRMNQDSPGSMTTVGHLASIEQPLPDTVDTVVVTLGVMPTSKRIPVGIASATLERNIQGFRPLSNQPIPMVPLGILERSPAGAVGWRDRVERGTTIEQMRRRREGKPALTGDVEPPRTITLRLPFAHPDFSTPADSGVRLLQLGSRNWRTFAGQIVEGIEGEHLAPYPNREFLLSKKSALPASAGMALPRYGSFESNNVLAALKELEGSKQPRIVPLFRVVPDRPDVVILTDFVAARLESVGLERDEAGRELLMLTLRPSVLETQTAITERSDPENAIDDYNPYVCKVRLVRGSVQALRPEVAEPPVPLPSP